MRKGLKGLDDSAKKTGGKFQGRLGFFGLAPGESITVRFLTELDDTQTVDFYEFIKVINTDVNVKGMNFAVAPDAYDDDTVTDWVKELGGQQVDFLTKELVEPDPKTKTVGIAVVRKEVATRGEKNRPVVSSEELWEEVESNGKKYEARKFIVIRMGYNNFWKLLRDQDEEFGTICDRDYKIKRVGEKLETTYTFIPRQEDPDWEYTEDPTQSPSYKALHETYGYGTDKTDVPDDERFAYCPQTVEEWIKESCSEERVKFFLTPGKEKADLSSKEEDAPAWSKGDDDEAQAAPPPATNGTSKKGSLAERLAAHK